MNDPGAFASLSPSLLARKGGAKPAMRPQLQPIQQFHAAAARDMAEDLGWNDMGEDVEPPIAETESESARAVPMSGAQVVPIAPAQSKGSHELPAVVQQRDDLTRKVEQAEAPRKSALRKGRRAAFTLRLDAERHLKLRLASTVTDQSAQQIVTDALDRYLETMPEVAALASRVRESR